MKKPLVPPILGLAFGILAVSTSSILIRFAQQEAPSLAVAALRLSFSTLVLAPFVLTRRLGELRRVSGRDWLLMLVSGLFLAFHFGTWITSLEYTSVASSVVLVQTAPLWVAVLAWLFLGEKPGRIFLVGMACSIVGGVLVGLGSACAFQAGRFSCSATPVFSGSALTGNLLALAGAVFVSGYWLIGRKLRAGLSLMSYTFVVYGTSAVFLLAGAALAGQSLAGYSTRLYLLCLALALVPQLLGHSTFNWALRYLTAGYVSIAALGEPIGSTILAFMILKQIPTPFELIGGVFILAGIILASQGQQPAAAQG